MPNINVTVYDSTENQRVPVELPDNAPCNKMVPFWCRNCGCQQTVRMERR